VIKDLLTKERRSWNMSRIRGKDTTPEKIVRSMLHRLGYRFRLHVRIPIEVGRVAPRAPVWETSAGRR
jgi:DNA mismatch endonuclease (patch repair protein)